MTDEMRVALVAVAMARGASVEDAWEIVDRTEVADPLTMTTRTADEAARAAWGQALVRPPS